MNASRDRCGPLREGIPVTVPYPPDVDLLSDGLSVAVHKGETRQSQNLLAFLPAKAGAGTSTIAMNAASAMAAAGRRVLLIDSDLRSGALSFHLSCLPVSSTQKALQAISEEETLTWNTYCTRAHNIDFLLSDRTRPTRAPTWAHYFALLRSATARYDSVLVDLPELVNPATAEIVQSARYVMVVTTQEVLSLKMAERRVRELIEWGVPGERIKILVNRWHKQEINQQEIEKFLKLPVFATFPNDFQEVRRATMAGAPVAASSSLGQSYHGIRAEAERSQGAGRHRLAREIARNLGPRCRYPSCQRQFMATSIVETRTQPIVTGADYIESLRGRGLKVYFLGERIPEPVDHPVIRPSINAVAQTYDLGVSHPDLATAWSQLSKRRVNRFLHVTESVDDVVQQNRMQRKLGQLTGTCFQRCVGMDAINSLYSVTFEMDRDHGSAYHERFKDFLIQMQEANYVIGGAMTDPKGDRSKAPADQADPDLFVRVVERRPDGVVIRGAKMHQTGCLNSHWILVMPTMRLREADRDYAITAAIPVDHPGLTFIYGRQSCDTRALEGGEIDQGNARYSGQEAMILIDDVFVPHDRVFMNGETAYAAMLVERFTSYHRRSYVCKTGLGDVHHRRRRLDRRLQRRSQRIPRQGQTGGDGAPERDHLRSGHRGLARIAAHPGGQLSARRPAGERLQAQRHPLPL